MQRSVAATLLGVLAVSAGAQERPLPDTAAFLQEVRKHLATDDERQTGYMYLETRREQRLDADGRPESESVKVFESYPALPGEKRWNRLIARDGQPVPPQDLEQADRERQRHVEEYARRVAQDPAAERARREREREREHRERLESIDDVFRVFDVRMIGRQLLEGHSTIVFSLTPRPDASPRTREGNIMKSFSGRVWISESDYELVKLDVVAIDTASIGLGLLARIHKGTRASFERRKVNGEAWLPAVTSYSASARVGLIKVLRRSGTSEFSGYKKFNVDTFTLYDRKPEKP